MSGKRKQRDIIDELIEIVDAAVDGWKPLSRWRRIRLSLSNIVLLVGTMFYMVVIYYVVRSLLPSIGTPESFLVVVIGLVSLILQFFLIIKELTPSEERERIIRLVTEWNYQRLIKKRVKKDHWLLLKALIHLKTLQKDFKLSEVRRKCPSLFIEENLVGILYNLLPLSVKTYQEIKTENMEQEKEDKEKPETKSLIAEYKVLNEAIWRRDQVSLLVNSIMISATLGVITFAIRFRSELGRSILTGLPNAGFIPLLCLILIIIPYLLWCTSTKLDNLCFDRIHEIEGILQIKGHHSILEHIKCNTRYKFRRHMWHVVFLLFIVVYLFTSYWLFRETVIP